MAELDQWSQANVIDPMFDIGSTREEWDATVEQVKKAIREKVLESYHNGQKAGPRKFVPRRPR